LAETEDDCREKNPSGFQNCVAFRLALHGFFNETTDYSPRCPGKQYKREKLLALSLFSWQSVRAFSTDSFRIMKCEPTSGQPGAREFDAAEETESRFARE